MGLAPTGRQRSKAAKSQRPRRGWRGLVSPGKASNLSSPRVEVSQGPFGFLAGQAPGGAAGSSIGAEHQPVQGQRHGARNDPGEDHVTEEMPALVHPQYADQDAEGESR